MTDTRPAFNGSPGEQCKCWDGWHEPGDEDCRFKADPAPAEQPEVGNGDEFWKQRAINAQDIAEEWQSRVAALQEALERYGLHKGGCTWFHPSEESNYRPVCTCGLAAALRGTETDATKNDTDSS